MLKIRQVSRHEVKGIVNEIKIAWDTEQCPRCKGDLEFTEDDDGITMTCLDCSWRGGFGQT